MRYYDIEKDIQQSMIIGWVIVFLLVIIGSVIITQLNIINTNTEEIIYSRKFYPNEITRDNSFKGNSFLKPIPSGYIGKEIKIVKTLSNPITINCDFSGSYDSNISLSDTINYFQPEYAYSDVSYLTWLTPPPVLLNRSIGFAYKVLPDYPLIALEVGKSGKVTVLVYVGVDGNLLKFSKNKSEYFLAGSENNLLFDIIFESPKDWFFASNVKKVIPRWRFLPHIEDGKPVGCFLRLTCHFNPQNNMVDFMIEN